MFACHCQGCIQEKKNKVLDVFTNVPNGSKLYQHIDGDCANLPPLDPYP